MKNTRRLIAGLSAMALATAIAPMSAFAINQNDVAAGNNEGTMTATYDVSAKYTVTIPAGVTLSDTATASQSIEASDVVLESGKKITVKLTGASNTESGASFSAKTTKGDSTATYTIGKGEATTGISVGDTVAEFTADGTQALTFSKAEGATYAGTHTETLTFGISVENAVNNPYAANNIGDVVTFGSYNWYIIGKSDDGVTLLMQSTLPYKKYNDSRTDVTWATCTLRTYLNGDFYNSFDAEDKAKIALTHNTNLDNPEYGTDGGDATDDYIYLLSIAEASALDNSIRAYNYWWWLRSPGGESGYAAVVYDDGDVSSYGDDVDDNIRVRPVLKLHFE